MTRMKNLKKSLALTLFLLGSNLTQKLFAQGGQGITEATNLVSGFYASGVQLMYAIGAVVGLIGAVKVFNKWNSGEPDTGKVAAAWFGSCVFLVIVAAVLSSFFNIPNP